MNTIPRERPSMESAESGRLLLADIDRWITRRDLPTPLRHLNQLTRRQRVLKRTADIVLAATLLILLAPLMLFIAVLVRLTSPGPALFRQVRVGWNARFFAADRRRSPSGPKEPEQRCQRERRQIPGYGRPFVMYKFRTMRTDAERQGAQFARKGDPRVTRLGRLLRRTRIDELPQLWNILRGDMSFVGPRPERPEFVGQLAAKIPLYPQRLGLKPGLTGLAQVVNGYDNELEGFQRKVALDLFYLENFCLRNDLKILLRTVGVIITGKGAV